MLTKKLLPAACLLLVLNITNAQTVNTKVSMVDANGKSYTGVITSVKDGQYYVKYDGHDFSAWLTKDQFVVISTTNTTTTTSQTQQTANTTTGTYKDTGGKLYFRTYMWTGTYGTSLEIKWIHLGNAGSIVVDPENGTNPVNYAAELKTNADNVGKYKIEGNKLLVTWSNGKTSSWSMERKNGDISALDGGIVTAPKAMPANYKLSGQYAGGAVLPNVSSIRTFVFNTDGSFTLSRSGAVNTPDVTAISQDTNGGTYTINGNTLRLNFSNGQKEVANILIWDMAGGKKYLVINGNSYPQER